MTPTRGSAAAPLRLGVAHGWVLPRLLLTYNARASRATLLAELEGAVNAAEVLVDEDEAGR